MEREMWKMFNWFKKGFAIILFSVRHVFFLLHVSFFLVYGALLFGAKNTDKTTTEFYEYKHFGKKFNFGTAAKPNEIKGWDRDVRFDGVGAPAGSGSVESGEGLYEQKCALCHGTFGEGEGRWPKLSGGEGTLKDQLTSRPEKTVGSYWPYASTLLDYIYRAMPYTEPRSLSPDQAYAITAYVLYLNEIVEDDFVLDKNSLKSIKMPNVANFILEDPRPDTKNTVCMKNCKDPNELKVLAHIQGVTPTAHLRQRISDQLNEAEEETPQSENTTLSEVALKGSQIYDGKCAICHANAVGGAPKIGVTEKTAWNTRASQGINMVVTHAIEGYEGKEGIMPAKGGFVDLTDEQVKSVVFYMLESSGVNTAQ